MENYLVLSDFLIKLFISQHIRVKKMDDKWGSSNLGLPEKDENGFKYSSLLGFKCSCPAKHRQMTNDDRI